MCVFVGRETNEMLKKGSKHFGSTMLSFPSRGENVYEAQTHHCIIVRGTQTLALAEASGKSIYVGKQRRQKGHPLVCLCFMTHIRFYPPNYTYTF